MILILCQHSTSVYSSIFQRNNNNKNLSTAQNPADIKRGNENPSSLPQYLTETEVDLLGILFCGCEIGIQSQLAKWMNLICGFAEPVNFFESYQIISKQIFETKFNSLNTGNPTSPPGNDSGSSSSESEAPNSRPSSREGDSLSVPQATAQMSRLKSPRGPRTPRGGPGAVMSQKDRKSLNARNAVFIFQGRHYRWNEIVEIEKLSKYFEKNLASEAMVGPGERGNGPERGYSCEAVGKMLKELKMNGNVYKPTVTILPSCVNHLTFRNSKLHRDNLRNLNPFKPHHRSTQCKAKP